MDELNEVLRYTKTNTSPLEMISIANKAIKIKDTDLDQVEFPFEEARNGEIINNEKGWVIQWTISITKINLTSLSLLY